MTKSRRRIRHSPKSKEKSYNDKHNNNNSNMLSIQSSKAKPQTAAEEVKASAAVIEDKKASESPGTDLSIFQIYAIQHFLICSG